MTIIARPLESEEPFSEINAFIAFQQALVSAQAAVLPTLTPDTHNRWTFTGSVTAIYTVSGDDAPVNYIAIAAHNLIGSEVQFSIKPTGGALTTIGFLVPSSNAAIIIRFPEQRVDEVRVSVEAGGITREIGVVFAGVGFQMQRPLYGGHSPINLSANTAYQTVMSETGQFLGRNIIRQGIETSFAWKNLTQDWYRENFQPFVDAARTRPFFIQWRPEDHPLEVAYGHTTKDIKPTNQAGGVKIMEVEISVRAHSDI